MLKPATVVTRANVKLNGGCCEMKGVVGGVWAGVASSEDESQSYVLVPGGRCGGIEWGEMGVFESASSDTGRKGIREERLRAGVSDADADSDSSRSSVSVRTGGSGHSKSIDAIENKGRGVNARSGSLLVAEGGSGGACDTEKGMERSQAGTYLKLDEIEDMGEGASVIKDKESPRVRLNDHKLGKERPRRATWSTMCAWAQAVRASPNVLPCTETLKPHLEEWVQRRAAHV
ncbi:hypothetical protein H4582DRAFT_2063053 [Lactarius indigo]|nr:hypothetical protein H4582DRAFT_2063053 [Lactarius indigo]